ncbi:hypothetical protein NPIL_189091 [Nephila pilipes]|uniref:Uncharacterized protein n=1 Tax=Nephila pilipes TaxID=299642 RepID=A0A8X6ML37_NEPPI|nr:hypothetical protein NPIL_189091 [Nephila pilipes]
MASKIPIKNSLEYMDSQGKAKELMKTPCPNQCENHLNARNYESTIRNPYFSDIHPPPSHNSEIKTSEKEDFKPPTKIAKHSRKELYSTHLQPI